MRWRMAHPRLCLLVLLLAVVGVASVQLAAVPAGPPKRASFEITNVLTVKVPEGAQRVRVWFAVPQSDTASDIRALNVEATVPVRYGMDSFCNKGAYMVVNASLETYYQFCVQFILLMSNVLKM